MKSLHVYICIPMEGYVVYNVHYHKVRYKPITCHLLLRYSHLNKLLNLYHILEGKFSRNPLLILLHTLFFHIFHYVIFLHKLLIMHINFNMLYNQLHKLVHYPMDSSIKLLILTKSLLVLR